MLNPLKIPAILTVALLASTASLRAQTGEFANIPPGSVVHQGYALQDWWQSLRNGTPEPPPPAVETAQSPVIIVPPQAGPNPVKPKKPKKVTANNQPKQPQ
jgi:hypothetical protein